MTPIERAILANKHNPMYEEDINYIIHTDEEEFISSCEDVLSKVKFFEKKVHRNYALFYGGKRFYINKKKAWETPEEAHGALVSLFGRELIDEHGHTTYKIMGQEFQYPFIKSKNCEYISKRHDVIKKVIDLLLKLKVLEITNVY